METFVRQLNNIFEGTTYTSFAVDVLEGKKEYKVICEIPGYSKEDINISYMDDTLSITVSKPKKKDDFTYLLRERTLTDKKRDLIIYDINADTIKAKYENGLLVISANKKEPSIKKVVIE